MCVAPDHKCGYTYPEGHEIGDSPKHQSCCYRESLDDAERCAWHADPNDTEKKNIESLQDARVDAEIRNQTYPVGELLDGAKLSGIELQDSIAFNRVALRNANLIEADLSRIEPTASTDQIPFIGADLTGAILRDADLTDAVLSGANLTGANLYGANLTRTELLYANLTDADLSSANLTDAKLFDADLTDARVRRSNLNETNLPLADLTDANLASSNLTGANFYDSNLTGVGLWDADLTNTKLNSANLFQTAIDHSEFEKFEIDDATVFGGKSRFEENQDKIARDSIPFLENHYFYS